MSKSVQSLSHVQLSVTTWTAACQASLSFTISPSLLKLMSIELVMLSNHLVLCCPLLLLPSVFPSIRVFSNESVLRIRWLKYWSFILSISPTNEYSGLISLRIDWFDLFAVHGVAKSATQMSHWTTTNLNIYLAHALAYISSLFLFIVKHYFIPWMYNNLFINSTADIHMGSLHNYSPV